MLGSGVLEFFLSIGFLFLILSILASAIVEWINRSIAMRPRLLREWFLNLDPCLGSRIADHPAINCLTPTGKDSPSYVSAEAFEVALLTVLSTTFVGEKTALGAPTGPTSDPLAAAMAAASASSVDRHFASVYNGLVVKSKESDGTGQELSILLTSLWATANTFGEGKVALARWYQDAQDRLSGKFKRFAQAQLLVVGLILAFALHADSFRIVQDLWQTSRITVAVERLGDPPTGVKDKVNTPKLALWNAVWDKELPLGWKPLERSQKSSAAQQILSQLSLASIFGMIGTAFAISLGANFWFELLSKLTKINPRQTGVKPVAVDEALRTQLNLT